MGYLQSGWCYFESSASGLRRGQADCFDLGRLPFLIPHSWFSITGLCRSNRQSPVAPDVFSSRLRQQVFRSQADIEIVDELYRLMFAAIVGENAISLPGDDVWPSGCTGAPRASAELCLPSIGGSRREQAHGEDLDRAGAPDEV